MTIVAGWDIGGAHLKFARVENGRVVLVRQVPCPLWLGVEHLHDALSDAMPELKGATVHAATMTGELAEVFPHRAEGVARIVETLAHALPEGQLNIYGGRAGILTPEEAPARWLDVASANWHASAALAAALCPEALFVDVGSTTTDIVPITDRAVAADGYTDSERLQTGELVYTGVMRTSLMALAAEVPFAGVKQRVTAENFSTTADIYRLTGELAAEDDQYPASDGRGKSPEECRARLARMLGRDAADTGLYTSSSLAWNQLARYFRERQLGLLYDAAAQALSGAPLGENAPIIGAGAGHFLARALAIRLARPYMPFQSLFPHVESARHAAGVAAPAVAVALLCVVDNQRL
jgi:probable H4MPT-linked C1 transfer pathway protein